MTRGRGTGRKTGGLRLRIVGTGLVLLSAFAAAAGQPLDIPESWTFRGVQEFVPVPQKVDAFCAHITNTLGKIGVRQLVIRFAYHYEYKSHPECRQGDALSEQQVRQIRAACEQAGIELIPGSNSFGHQHPEGGNGILGSHPELSETRGEKDDAKKGTRSLCAKSEEARRIATDLLLELAEVCGAKRVHIGCDEVMELGLCDRCKGVPHEKLYADWVNGLARGLKQKGYEVLMWGDRLIDTRDYWNDDLTDETYDGGMSGTKDAVKLVDRDITICDWQYFVRRDYPSLRIFRDNGYKTIISTWIQREGGTKSAEAVIAAAKKADRGQIKGFLLTSWHDGGLVPEAYDGKVPMDADFNERRRSSACQYLRTLQLFFPKVVSSVHDGWTWWNGAEDPFDPIEGKGFEPRGKVNYFYDRLPVAHSNEIPRDVWELQKDTAGEVLRFKTGSDKLRIRWKPRKKNLKFFHMPATGVSGVDVYQQEPDGTWRFVAPPFPAVIGYRVNDYTWTVKPNRPTLVYLPLYNGIESLVLGVRAPHDVEPIGPHQSGVTKPVVIYGTSTTQGGCASRPGRCWTSVAGREADVPVVNLGFSGSGRMEDVLGECLAEIDASLYVLDTVGNMEVPLLKERFEKFVRRLRAKKPGVPIAISVNLWAADWADRNNFLRELFIRLKQEDPVLWKDLYLLGDDRAAIDPDGESAVDGYHLNDLGSERFGKYMGGRFAAILGLEKGKAAPDDGAVEPIVIPESWTFRGVQEHVPAPEDVDAFCAHVTNTLGKIGVRQLVIRFAYHYEFKSHPECRQKSALTEAQVRQIRAACDAAGIELIPKMNLFGHQHPLFPGAGNGPIDAHPEFSETRGSKDPLKDTPCLCAKSEEARKIVADLMLELAGVCGAKRVHIGCDEVMELGLCDRCKGVPHEKLYADWVNGLARALKQKGYEVLMWGDRLIDTRDYWNDDMTDEAYDKGMSGTKGALKLIDRDITICDWQYFVRREYPSLRIFRDNGYQVILSPWNWRGPKASERFFAAARKEDQGQIKGFLLTSWDACKLVREAYEGKIPMDDDYNERRRSSACHYQRTLQRLFPKSVAALHGGWSWWNGAEDPLDPVEGKGYEPRGKVNRFYDRLPVAHSNEIPKAVWNLQKDTAGEVFRFKTGSDKLRIRWKPRKKSLDFYHMPSTGMSGVDVYQQEPDGAWRFVPPPFPAWIGYRVNDYTWTVKPNRPTLVYLPLYNGIESIVFGVRAPYGLEPLGPHQSGVTKPVVIYGTSTTQGGCVSRPGMCWTSVAGREADVPVVNLGFSGSGKMEDVMCECLAEIDASLYVLDTVGNMDIPMLRERFEKFVRRLRAKKPGVPIAITANVWTVTKLDRTDVLREIFEKLRKEDPVLWKDLYFWGDDKAAIDPDGESVVDGCHLNDLGSMRFGKYMGARIGEVLTSRK